MRGWSCNRIDAMPPFSIAARRGSSPTGFAVAAMLVLALVRTAAAQPPPDADPALAPWFRSLLQPGTDISCCSVADCRAAEYRIEHDHYEVLIDGTWRAVPPDKVLQRTDNPTGHAIVCWTRQRGIMCFVRATES
jgi:hypothetical protein